MARSQGMRICVGGMLGWVISFAAVSGALGAYPTWKGSGWAGLKGELVAAGIVLGVKILSSIVVVGKAARGAGPAAIAFVVLAMARAVGCVALAAAALATLSLSGTVLFVWVVIFYLVTLAAECIWLVKALRDDARRIALGEVGRAGTPQAAAAEETT